jgi:tRNA-2-methylthio-N6-dimethylallyladenosine synthase
MSTENKKYNIWTIGCQMNEADSRHLASCLERFGYAECPCADDADLVVLNTCVVRASAEDKVHGKLQYLQGLKLKRPEIKIVLMGCFVGRGRKSHLEQRFPFVDIFMPPSDISPLSAHLEQMLGAGTHAEGFPAWDPDELYYLPQSAQNSISANVPAVLGCSHACTYCVIPYRRGREHSRPRADVLAEARALLREGVKEIVLLGQIVDRYGTDFADGYHLGDLLRDTAALEGLERVRFLTSHPGYLDNALIETVAREAKVCPHFELPCQSGSDEILAAMRRGYDRAQFIELVGRLRSAIPEVAINTDVIVGFPGESEEQFMDTYRLLEELRFDTVHIAKYSPRPQTYAARRLADDVAAPEKERRRLMLEALQKQIQSEENAALLGTRVAVLVEERDERHGRWRGRTPQNKLVFVEDTRPLKGEIVHAKVTWAGPFSMLAEC